MTLKTSLVGALAAVLLFSIAPAALAQGIPDTSDIVGSTGGVTDAVGGTTDGATDAVDGETDTVGGTVDGATDAVGETTDGATDSVDDGTDTVGGTVGDTTGGVTDTVGDATGGEGGGSVTDPVTDVVDDITDNGSGSGSPRNGPTGTVVDDLLGSDEGSSLDDLTPGLIGDLVDGAAAGGLTPAAAEGWIEGQNYFGGSSYGNPVAALASLTSLIGDLADDVFGGDAASGTNVTLTPESSNRSFFDSAGRAAVAAAKALAFPAALALLVVAFLIAQGRIGRKDPKLALAPVDTAHESLSFE